MKSLEKNVVLSTLAVGVLLMSTTSYAQQGTTAASSSQSGAMSAVSGDTLGGFVGFTDRRDADFSFGLHYGHKINQEWGVGAVVEHTPDAWFGDAATLVLGTANFYPDFNERLQLTAGAGVEFKDIGGDDVKFRAGLSYDLFLEDKITVAPLVAFNLGEGKDSVTVGAVIKYQFR